MTTVPGTYFTKEQLEADLKVDNVSGVDRTDTNRMYQIGNIYYTEKKQYDKALAWYLLAARENSCDAQNNIGVLYYYGYGVPKNYLCALKWQLKSAERNDDNKNHKNIGMYFEYGINVPIDKYKALEWYCHSKNKQFINKLKGQGYHRSASDKKKTLQQLIKETGAILNAEKRKLEAKNKTQQEIETLIDLNITYKLLDNGKDAWKDVPILVADDKQRYTKPAKSSVRNNADEILEQQVQLINQDRRSFQSQGNQFQQETTKLELQPKEKDEEIVALRNDNQSLQGRNSIIQDQTKIHTSENNSLQSENQELKLQINSLEYQLKEKDNKISLLKNENRNHRTSSVQQIQQLETLNHEKSTLEQNKIQASIEMEQLAASNNTLLQNQQDMSIKMERLKVYNASLEQLLKSEQGATVSLNGEDKDLSTANQFIIEMMETQKTLLLAKTNEMELLRQNMERLEQENRALKQERIQDQINTQSTSRLNNSMVNPSSVGSNHDSDNDDAQNDINYDSELEGDDGEDNDINYDTPSEDDIECP